MNFSKNRKKDKNSKKKFCRFYTSEYSIRTQKITRNNFFSATLLFGAKGDALQAIFTGKKHKNAFFDMKTAFLQKITKKKVVREEKWRQNKKKFVEIANWDQKLRFFSEKQQFLTKNQFFDPKNSISRV